MTKLDEALGLFPSCIKSGENWSPTCQAVLEAAKTELAELRRCSAEAETALEEGRRFKKMYYAEVKAAAESKARCNEALGWANQELQTAKSSHEGQLRNTLAFKAEAETAQAGLWEAVEALLSVRKIISEGALVGFNHADGDWAERLFASQAATSAAIKKLSTIPTDHQSPQGGETS